MTSRYIPVTLALALLSTPAMGTGYTTLKPLKENIVETSTPEFVAVVPLDPIITGTVTQPRVIGHAPIPENLEQSIAFLMRGKVDPKYQTNADVWSKIKEFYRSRDNKPIWVTDKGYTKRAVNLGKRLLKAKFDGLNIAHYPLVDLPQSNASNNQLAAADLHLTISAIEYISDLSSGIMNPKKISGYITYKPQRPDVIKVLEALSTAPNPARFVNRYEPQNPQYRKLKALLIESYDKAKKQEEVPLLPKGISLKWGIEHPAVRILRTRLNVRQGNNPELFDDVVLAAVKTYQKNNRLGPDGIVGPRTRQAINGTVDAKVSAEILMVNMERLRWLPRDLGKFRVEVNIPEYRVRVFDGKTKAYDGRVIVGKLKHQTPQFADEFEYVEVNPYWNVPQSIATKEMLPRLISNASYLDARGYEVISHASGKRVSSSSINWSQYAGRNALPFRVRQPPGRKNALGNVKFMFPNKHAVYLHDTPSRNLFNNSRRAYSHGCVRVHNPFDFADVLLRYEKMTGSRLKSLVGGRNQAIRLKRKIPITISYFTVRVDEEGRIKRYSDIYGYDKRMLKLMGFERS